MSETNDTTTRQHLAPEAIVEARRGTSWLPFIGFLTPLWNMSVAIFFMIRHHTLFASSFAAAAMMFAPVAVMQYRNMKKNIDKVFSSYDRNGNQITVDAA